MESLNKLLGRDYFVRGMVRKGDGRGRQIGFPTANLELQLRKLPKVGVYVTETEWRGKKYPSITNVGRNPTFKGDGTDLPVVVETNIFNFDADIYGETIAVHFHKYLRPEQKFAGIQSLVEQIKLDVQTAKNFFSA
jgi:riboflavin kinase / FMN adenylyltransferase